MKSYLSALAGLIAISCGLATTHAAFIVEADNVPVAGKANDHFSSLPPGTGFSLSATPSFAAGLAGNQSAFGNPANSTGPDQYTFRYTPGVDVDNTVYSAAQVLGNSEGTDSDGLGPILPTYANIPQLATGLTGGVSGLYNVYFTTPQTTGSNAAGSQFVITHDGGSTDLNPVDTNNGGTGNFDTNPSPTLFVGGANDLWLKIASNVHLTAGTTYTITQTANFPAFVSQRAHGVMWELVSADVPEPSSLALMGLALVGLGMRRK